MTLALPTNVVSTDVERCAYCTRPAEGNHTIHRDGFGEGPEVQLCDACGSHPTPTCEEIWARIARPPEES